LFVVFYYYYSNHSVLSVLSCVLIIFYCIKNCIYWFRIVMLKNLKKNLMKLMKCFLFVFVCCINYLFTFRSINCCYYFCTV